MSSSFPIAPEIQSYVKLGNPPRLLLSGITWFVHFLSPVLLGLLSIVVLYLEFVNPPESFSLPPYASMISVLATLFATYRRRKKLRFTPIASRHTAGQTYEIVVEAAGVAGWKIVHSIPGAFLRIWTIPSEDESTNYGELVTVIFREGVVLINSINDPSDWLHLYSGSANKGHAEWIETTLEKGVWKYDPTRAIEKKERAMVLPPRAAIILEDIADDNPPRFRIAGTELESEWITGSLIVGLRFGLEIAEGHHLTTELRSAITIGLPLLLALLVRIFLRLRSRFTGIETERTDEENYVLVRQALQESGWHVNYEDMEKGIEARIPYSTPKKGNVGVFIFRNRTVYVNIFNGADSPYPAFRFTVRASVIQWLRSLLLKGESIRYGAAGFPLLQGKFGNKEGSITGDISIPAFGISAPLLRLTLYGERWRRMFGGSIGFVLLGALLCLPIAVVHLSETILICTIMLAGSLVLIGCGKYVIRRRRLHFRSVAAQQSEGENFRRVHSLCKEMGWTVNEVIPNQRIEAYRKKDDAECAEMITIAFNGNSVYVNSINKLNNSRFFRTRYNVHWRSARYSPKRNRENVERVIEAVTAPKENIERAEEA